MKVIYNTLWMIIEKLILSLSLLIINAYVARYLGPSQYGVISYIITLLSISVVVSNFGSNTLIFQKISKNSYSAKTIIPTVQVLRSSIYLLCTALMFVYLYLSGANFDFYLVIGLAIAFYFQAIDSYSWYNDAKLNSKYNSVVNTIALIVAIITRYFLVKWSLELQWFTIPYICNYAISYFLKRYFFIKKEAPPDIISLIFKRRKHTLKTLTFFIIAGAPLFLSEISILLYTRLTNLYLGEINSIDAVGVFNASYVIATAWTIIPLAFITSVYTVIYKEKSTRIRIAIGAFLMQLITIGGLVFVVFCLLFKDQIIHLIYGVGFKESAGIFPILILSSVFSILGVISYRMIIAMYGYKYIAKKMIVMGLISIPLNYFLIKSYGVVGAAYSIAIIELISATVANYFFKGGLIARMHLKTIIKPLETSSLAISEILKK